MKYILILFSWLLWSGSIWGQRTTDSLLLQHIQKVPLTLETDIEGLTNYLVHPFQKEEDKLRSIYLWLIHTIQYDTSALDNKRINKNNQDILNRKKAICWGLSLIHI